MKLCGKVLVSRSRFAPEGQHRCFRLAEHQGACTAFPYLEHFAEVAPNVAKKIVRDAVMTTGAAWKSEDAGPNRIRRWAMLLPDDELLKLKVNMSGLKPQVRAKLREKAASYEACMGVAVKLTALAYGMSHAPSAPTEIRQYLEDRAGPVALDSTACLVCRSLLDFGLFLEAKRGRAAIETAHSNPRLHTPENVGFAHRACNIAQGDKTLDEFYEWIDGILQRARGRH